MSEDRLDRIEKSLEKMAEENLKIEVMVKRMGRYAMVIARIHEDELASHHKRLLALEED